jgi:hypothetical protein
MLLFTLLACSSPEAAECPGESSFDPPDDNADWLFHEPTSPKDVPKLSLELTDAAMDRLRDYDEALNAWHLDPDSACEDDQRDPCVPSPKSPKVCAQLGTPFGVIGGVHVQLKGKLFNSYQPVDSKPYFEVTIDREEDLPFVGGNPKFRLYNQWQDVSQVARYLGNHIWLDAGYPAARTGFATLSVNDRDLGLYGTNSSTATEEFFQASFGNQVTPFYEGDYGADFVPGTPVERLIDQAIEHDEKSDADLVAFAASAGALDADPCELEDLNVDLFLQFWALETLIGAQEGYTYLTNNYNVGKNPDLGYVLTPTGFDEALINPQLVCAPSGRLASQAMHSPSCRAKEKETLARLNDPVTGIPWQKYHDDAERLFTVLNDTDFTDSNFLLPYQSPEILINQDKVRQFLGNAPGRNAAMLEEDCPDQR